MDHISKDYRLYLLELVEDGDEKLIYIRHKFVKPNIKACYVTPQINEDEEYELPVIQTVLFHEDEYEIDFYVDSNTDTSKLHEQANRVNRQTEQQNLKPYKLLKT